MKLPPRQLFEGVGKLFLSANGSNNQLQIGEVLWLSAVLDFHRDGSGKLVHILASKPEDWTDGVGVLRELILASYRGLDVDGALLHACWQAALRDVEPQAIAWPCDLLIVGRVDHHSHFPTHFHTTQVPGSCGHVASSTIYCSDRMR